MDGIASPAAKGVPKRALEDLIVALSALRWIADMRLNVRQQLDIRLGGNGRYEVEALTNRAADIEYAHKKVQQFRDNAAKNGVDADAVIARLGGVADLTPSPNAAKWLDDEAGR
jgi:hypothetical protein